MSHPEPGAHVLRSGDTVLLALNMAATMEHAQRLLDRLGEVFPDVKFCIIDNVTGILIAERA